MSSHIEKLIDMEQAGFIKHWHIVGFGGIARKYNGDDIELTPSAVDEIYENEFNDYVKEIIKHIKNEN